MSTLKSLIFDVDGTLADTEEIHRQAFNTEFKNAGLDWNWSQEMYLQLLAVTGGKERIRHYIDTCHPPFEAPEDLSEYIAGLHAGKTRVYTEMMASGQVKLRPGILRLLKQSRQEGIRLAIATTTTLANVEALLHNTLGADGMEWFEVIGAGDVVDSKKPAPDIYLYTLQQLGLNADQCIALEDSENGIHSSSAAGLCTVITTNAFTAHHNFDGAALVVDQMGEPESGFETLQGDSFGHTFVDLDLLRKIQQHR